MYSVDLTAGPAGPDHLRGPVQHRQGSEDSQAAPSSSGCIPLRWYQGKNLQTRITTMSDLTWELPPTLCLQVKGQACPFLFLFSYLDRNFPILQVSAKVLINTSLLSSDWLFSVTAPLHLSAVLVVNSPPSLFLPLYLSILSPPPSRPPRLTPAGLAHQFDRQHFGLFWLRSHQVAADAAGPAAPQSPLQIWRHEGKSQCTSGRAQQEAPAPSFSISVWRNINYYQ